MIEDYHLIETFHAGPPVDADGRIRFPFSARMKSYRDHIVVRLHGAGPEDMRVGRETSLMLGGRPCRAVISWIERDGEDYILTLEMEYWWQPWLWNVN
jgi:hypothetical protein